MSLVITGLVALGVALVGLALFYPYPESFPGLPRLTHTASGVAGDPINLVLIGDQAQITQSFRQAGWLVPDPITPQTTARIAAASLSHQPYPTAPVSPLYVFGRPQDLAFEKPTSDVQNRGHIRLWLTGTRLGGQEVWIAQVSYDQGIELSASTHFPTHHIAPAVDREREAAGADLEHTGLVTSTALTAFAPPTLYARNGGGDFYASDGDALVINFTSAAVSLAPPAPVIAGLKARVFLLYDALVSLPLWALAALALAVALLGAILLARRARRSPVSRVARG
ncbi:MAG TPA: LssY C-terminal domain-containing protein [Ktedonobacterales bacterium]